MRFQDFQCIYPKEREVIQWRGFITGLEKYVQFRQAGKASKQGWGTEFYRTGVNRENALDMPEAFLHKAEPVPKHVRHQSIRRNRHNVLSKV
jgi:hypothetical protein